MIKKKKILREKKRQIRGHGELGFFGNHHVWGNQYSGKDWINEQNKKHQYGILDLEEGINIENQLLQDEKVVYIQPSEAEAKLRELKKRGQPFLDQKFPASQKSLMGDQYIHNWSKITWKPLSQFMPSAQIFVDKIEPKDIRQGMLGNCYFLAGLAALAERPDRIFNLFLLHEKNKQRFYSVKILYRGKWKRIDLDEFVPVLGKNLIFSQSNKNELWVIFMEKAWAKLYGSYKQTEAGFPVEALHDLTGAPIKSIFLQSRNFDKEAQWQYLLKASQREYAMVASSNPGSDSNRSKNGVHQGHAYTFLNALYLNLGGRQERLVQLRNPWGVGEFTGKWSDYDPKWNWVPTHEKKRLHFNKNKKDGIFFMAYDDFISEFRTLTVAQINDNASYVYCSKKDRENKGVHFLVSVKKQGKYCFQVGKTPQRSYTGEKASKFNYPHSILDIVRIDTLYNQSFGGLATKKRTLFKKMHLVPGQYIAKVNVAYDPYFETDFEVTLAVYSEYSCCIRLAKDIQIKKSLEESNQYDIRNQQVCTPNPKKYCSRRQNPELSPILQMSAERASSRDHQQQEQENYQFVKIDDLVEEQEQRPSPTTDKNSEIPTYEHSSKKQSDLNILTNKRLRTKQYHITRITQEKEPHNGEKIVVEKKIDRNRDTIAKHGGKGKTTNYKEYENHFEKKKHLFEGEVKNEEQKYFQKFEKFSQTPSGEITRQIQTNIGTSQNREEEGTQSEFSSRPSMLQIESEASSKIETPPKTNPFTTDDSSYMRYA